MKKTNARELCKTAERLKGQIDVYSRAANVYRTECAKAEAERKQGNAGNADDIMRNARQAFTKATEGASQGLSDGMHALNEGLATWRNQADATDPLIQQATALLSTTGRDTPRQLVESLIEQAKQPYQMQYLETLFAKNNMTGAAAKVHQSYLEVPQALSGDLGTAAYISTKHGGPDDSAARLFEDASNRCSAVMDYFKADADAAGEE